MSYLTKKETECRWDDYEQAPHEPLGAPWLSVQFPLAQWRRNQDYLWRLAHNIYGRYENGTREPSIDVLLKLSALYGVSVDYLIGNEMFADTSITAEEQAMLKLLRQADERAWQDTCALLELHKVIE